MSEREDVEAEPLIECFGDVKVTEGVWACSCGIVLANTREDAISRRPAHLLISLAAHDEAVRVSERVRLAGEVEALDDAVCSCIMAARWGKYDGRTVESHLQSLLDDVRALVPVPGVRLTEEE